MNNLKEVDMEKVLDVCYQKVLNGLPGMGSAEELAHDYLFSGGNLSKQVDELIKWQIAKCTTSGFLIGVCHDNS